MFFNSDPQIQHVVRDREREREGGRVREGESVRGRECERESGKRR